ncbi:DUF4376 domain-containing protein [Peribacillus asahii]|nr:DUF4376 domain-containing protein [Peribacillus asahii]USK72728.1 DUF4376 domain-containing protein [Peribacillus asahii]
MTCEEEILKPFTATNGHVYAFEMKDQINFNQQLSLITLDESITEIIWKTEDSGVLVHTRDEFIQVVANAETHKRSNITKYWTLKAQVQSATTIEGIEAITW